jgi:hypothetical protein
VVVLVEQEVEVEAERDAGSPDLAVDGCDRWSSGWRIASSLVADESRRHPFWKQVLSTYSLH